MSTTQKILKGLENMYTWDKSWETGNATIDSQHKTLIKAINDLLEACSKGQGRSKIADTVKFLREYTATHFGDEERLQQSSGYPDYANHVKLHNYFKGVVAEIETKLAKEGATITVISDINSKCATWLINHIKTQDKKVAMHLLQKV
jgi:hemerythrin-like metal-binding protein